MSPESLLEMLKAVKDGLTSPEEGVKNLAKLPYEELGFAKLDHHRALRTGLPEVIYGAGKTDDQVAEIFDRMALTGENVLATRVSLTAAQRVLEKWPTASHHTLARTLTLRQKPPIPSDRDQDQLLAVVCAGTSDLPVAEEAATTAEILGHQVLRITDVSVAGLHRLLAQRDNLATAKVIIVCAGMEGALPTVVAGLVRVPVIAVPTSIGYGAALGGVAALLGMLNSCSPNIAVVNIDNGFGAACFAHSILGLNLETGMERGENLEKHGGQ